MQPYSAGVNNTYYGYDGSGRLLVKESGSGVYFPAALSLRDGFALSFRRESKDAGSSGLRVVTPNEYIDRKKSLADLSSGAFFYSLSEGDGFCYLVQQFRADGKVIDTVIDDRISLPISGDGSFLMFVNRPKSKSNPFGNRYDYKLLSVDLDGNKEEYEISGAFPVSDERMREADIEFEGGGVYRVSQRFGYEDGCETFYTSFFQLGDGRLEPLSIGVDIPVPETLWPSDGILSNRLASKNMATLGGGWHYKVL